VMIDERQAPFERVGAGRATPEDQARFGAQQVLDAPEEALFEVRAVESRTPSKARELNSLLCAEYGEMTMEARTRRFQRRVLCIPRFTALESQM
jgi:formylmethanofuran dehydrogenase subunit E